MTTKFLLLLLPSIVYGEIKIQIKSSSDDYDASVDISGFTDSIITDKERDTFRIQDAPLKDAVKSFTGDDRPDDAFLHSPTPWDDLYSRFGWKQVRRIVFPKSARIVEINTIPVVVSTQITYNGAISHDVEDTVSSTWSKSGELSMGQEISYSIVLGGGIGGTTSLTYTSSWGEATSKTKSVTVGSTSGVQPEQTGRRLLATLSAMRVSMTVEVEYEAYLDGKVATNFGLQHKGHYFYAFAINDVLRAAGLPETLMSKEVIKIEFYSEATVQVDDFLTNETLYYSASKITS